MSYSADSNEGRILLALRAGAHEIAEINARFSTFSTYIGGLIRQGLVEKVGESYRLTKAGRAACPWRNPEAAPHAIQPKENTMSKPTLHREQVLAAIVAAGPQGITRRQLIDHFQAGESAVDMHVLQLNRQQPPVIFKPRLGLLVAIEFQGAAPATHDIHGVSLDVDHHEALDLSTKEHAIQMKQIAPSNGAHYTSPSTIQKLIQAPPLVEDIDITDPETVEFAIYSSGGIDIIADEGTVTMTAPVLAKLRTFLGLLEREAA